MIILSKSEVDGITEIMSFIRDTQKEMPENMEDFMYGVGLDMTDEASKNVPYDTGYLWSTIDSEVSFSSENKEVLIYADADYADEVEFGTSNKPASLFMTKAYNRISANIENDFTKKVLDKI